MGVFLEVKMIFDQSKFGIRCEWGERGGVRRRRDYQSLGRNPLARVRGRRRLRAFPKKPRYPAQEFRWLLRFNGRNSQNEYIETVAATLAVFLAACALGLSLYEGYQDRRHNRLSVKPAIDFSLHRAKTLQHVGLLIHTKGVGPAHIKRVFLFINGEEFPIKSAKDLECIRSSEFV